MARSFRKFLPLVILVLTAGHLPAFDTVPTDITGEFWTRLDPLFRDRLDLTTTEKERESYREHAVESILEEVRYVFSGQIYGFTFSYTPYDSARTTEEVFLLEPVARIERGGGNLEIRESEISGDTLRLLVRYDLEETQRARIGRWQTNTLPSASGTGRADIFAGEAARTEAIESGIKEAVRNYLRTQTFNKPKKAEGGVLLLDTPRIFMKAGQYAAQVRVRIDVRNVIHYETY